MYDTSINIEERSSRGSISNTTRQDPLKRHRHYRQTAEVIDNENS